MSDQSSVFETTKAWAEQNSVPLWSEAQTTSTSDRAKDEATSVTEPIKLYLTDQQSSGRGRGENIWLNAKPGSCLLSTWSFQVNSPPQHITAPLMGLALLKAVRAIWPKGKWSLKAPNDLFLGNKKVAGLLSESITQGETHRLIVGLGMDIFDHPAEIELAGHLSEDETCGFNFDKWPGFLGFLKSELYGASQTCQQTALSQQDRNDILDALNANPQYHLPILEIRENGNMVTASAEIEWQSI